MTTGALERTVAETDISFPIEISILKSGTFARKLRVEWPTSGAFISFDSAYEYDFWLLTRYLRPDATIIRNTTKITFPEPVHYEVKGKRYTVNAYKPDFMIFDQHGFVEWVEVKGWENARHQAIQEAMRKHHPNIEITLITKEQMIPWQKEHSNDIPGWVKIK